MVKIMHIFREKHRKSTNRSNSTNSSNTNGDANIDNLKQRNDAVKSNNHLEFVSGVDDNSIVQFDDLFDDEGDSNAVGQYDDLLAKDYKNLKERRLGRIYCNQILLGRMRMRRV